MLNQSMNDTKKGCVFLPMFCFNCHMRHLQFQKTSVCVNEHLCQQHKLLKFCRNLAVEQFTGASNTGQVGHVFYPKTYLKAKLNFNRLWYLLGCSKYPFLILCYTIQLLSPAETFGLWSILFLFLQAKIVPFYAKICPSLSFAIQGDQSFTRSLRSTPFQNPREGYPERDGAAAEQYFLISDI